MYWKASFRKFESKENSEAEDKSQKKKSFYLNTEANNILEVNRLFYFQTAFTAPEPMQTCSDLCKQHTHIHKVNKSKEGGMASGIDTPCKD